MKSKQIINENINDLLKIMYFSFSMMDSFHHKRIFPLQINVLNYFLNIKIEEINTQAYLEKFVIKNLQL